ncbi:MAG TPA: hybrid sensor histidine kinase/response regulator [Cyanobacteria bacterium UBA11049]|nr:hybrid sensor histidine kinase/response regulator [Cyanobacteria bacterium UBA11049]
MKKILVIEDEAAVRVSLLDLLNAENYQVFEAGNGKTGVELAKAHLPDLIVCDVMMPELDGFGVLTALNQEPSTATIPFIFLTAKADKTDIRQGMELGADDYLIKPFTRNELLGAISARLQKQITVTQQSEKKLAELRRGITEALPQEALIPLSEILGFSRMLLDSYEVIKPQELLETAQNLHNSGQRLQRLIENFIMYAQIELLATSPEEMQALRNCQTLNPSDIIFAIAIQKAKQYHREADLILQVANSNVKIAKRDLKKVVEELVDNAFKFSELDTSVHVKASADKDGFKLAITNYGCPMPPEQIASIGGHMHFERKFYERQGMGLGLILAKRITELHGGRLTIESGGANSKTTVFVTLQR